MINSFQITKTNENVGVVQNIIIFLGWPYFPCARSPSIKLYRKYDLIQKQIFKIVHEVYITLKHGLGNYPKYLTWCLTDCSSNTFADFVSFGYIHEDKQTITRSSVVWLHISIYYYTFKLCSRLWLVNKRRTIRNMPYTIVTCYVISVL